MLTRPSASIEDVLKVLRLAWVAQYDAPSDIRRAIALLRRIQQEAAVSQDVDETIAGLMDELDRTSRLPVAERKAGIERVANHLKALQPRLDGDTAPAPPKGALPEQAPPKRTKPRQAHSVGSLPMDAPVHLLQGVGPEVEKKLGKLGIQHIDDILRLAPRRYIDFTNTARIGSALQTQGDVTLRGQVTEIREVHGSGKPRVTMRLYDGSGSIRLTWFNTWISRQIREGDEIYVSGHLEFAYGTLQMTSPEWERVGGPHISTGRLIPVYPSTQGLAQKSLRKLTRQALDATRTKIIDPLGPAVRKALPERLATALMPLEEAFEQLHYPEDEAAAARARARLMFENLLLLQLGLVHRKQERKSVNGVALTVEQPALSHFYGELPFALTRAQRRAIAEILADIQQPKPMTRLLQGDVGSGKTVVAATIAHLAKQNGFQTAIMAPTEILAEQHERSVSGLYAALPEEMRPTVALLTGSTKASERKKLSKALLAGEIDVLVGTQALIQEPVMFHRLGLIVIDEQHRFGVRQRSLLAQKADGYAPHTLSMTATPIPRTLNLVLHGDLDVSIIDERPPGRTPIETRRYLGAERHLAYDLAREEVAKGHQVFVICPLVEASETIEARAAVEEAERLQNEVFPDLRIAVLHGKLPAKQKDAVMTAFRDHEYDMLVSTSVIEVGIDIPNATVMMIEGADRFGLSQLHQFRGRVGRGAAKSFCLLLADETGPEGEERLQTMVASDDGFVLAQKDLELRGPGDIIGTRQSGLPELGWLEQGFDSRLLDVARETAETLLANDPGLDAPELLQLKLRMMTFWSSSEPDEGLS